MTSSIWFTMETWQRFKEFIINRYGIKRALSITFEEAVNAYRKDTKNEPLF